MSKHRKEYRESQDKDHPTNHGVCRGKHCAWHRPKHAEQPSAD